MPTTIDDGFAPPISPGSLGQERFVRLAAATGAAVHTLPMDLGGKVFQVAGGVLPSLRSTHPAHQ